MALAHSDSFLVLIILINSAIKNECGFPCSSIIPTDESYTPSIIIPSCIPITWAALLEAVPILLPKTSICLAKSTSLKLSFLFLNLLAKCITWIITASLASSASVSLSFSSYFLSATDLATPCLFCVCSLWSE